MERASIIALAREREMNVAPLVGREVEGYSTSEFQSMMSVCSWDGSAEDVNGCMKIRSHEESCRRKNIRVPPILATHATCITSIDYADVGTIGQANAVRKTLHTVGVHQSLQIAGGPAGNPTQTADLSNVTTVVCGVRLDWSVRLLNAVDFDLDVTLTNFRTLFPANGAASLNRAFRVRVAARDSAGGSVYIPLAMRISPSQTRAQFMPGLAMDEEGAQATLTVQNIPANIVNDFGFLVVPLTAFHPATVNLFNVLDRAG